MTSRPCCGRRPICGWPGALAKDHIGTAVQHDDIACNGDGRRLAACPARTKRLMVAIIPHIPMDIGLIDAKQDA